LTPTFAIADPVIKEIYYQKKTSLAYPATYTFRFSLWDAEVGGNEVWFEEKPLKLTNNLIKTYLGDLEPLDSVDFSLQYWVQVDQKRKTGHMSQWELGRLWELYLMLCIAPQAFRE
jgi:hypothetical protein